MQKRKQLPPPPESLGVLMLDVRQVAVALNMGVSTVWKLVKANAGFPTPLYISPRTIRWRASEVKAWAEGSTPTAA